MSKSAAVADLPGDRAEIDDGAAAGIAHLRPYRLGGEELVAQIDRHAVVPVGHRDVLGAVPVVVAGIVDERADRPVAGRHLGHRGAQALDIAQVAFDVARPGMAARGDPLDQGPRGLGRKVDEGDARTLGAEMLDQALADAGAAAGDEDNAVAQAGIGREVAVGHELNYRSEVPNIVGHAQWRALSDAVKERCGVLTGCSAVPNMSS
jgi:hypothetical protein